MSSLHEKMAAIATVMEVDRNLRFTPQDEDRVWFVKQGKLELFYSFAEEDLLENRLEHLLRVETGGLLLGMNPARVDGEPKLSAVGGIGTEILAMDRSDLLALAEDPQFLTPLADLLDGWVTALGNTYNPGNVPRSHHLLKPEAKEVAAKDCLLAQEGPLWLDFAEIGASYPDVPDPETHQLGLLPVTRHLWARVGQDGEIHPRDTAACLAEGRLKPALAAFGSGLLARLQFLHQQSRAQERERQEQKTDYEQQMIDEALSHFAGVFGEKQALAHVTVETTDPLYAAAELVASAGSIQLDPDAKNKYVGKPDPLGSILRTANIRQRKVILAGEWWRQDNGPLLTTLESSKGPVALIPTSSRRYEMIDPIGQTRLVVDDAIAEQLGPEAVMFYRPLPGHALGLKDLFSYGRVGIGKDLLAIALMGAAGGLIGLVAPFATGLIFDQVIPESSFSDLTFIALGLIVAAFAGTLFMLTQGLALVRFEGKLDANLQAAIWDRILSLPVPFFRDYSSGDLMSRAMGVETIRATLSGSVVMSIISSVFSITYLFQLFYYSWQMAFVALGLCVLALVPLALGLVKVRLARRRHHLEGKLTGLVLQLILGITKLKVSGSEARAFAAWAQPFSQSNRLTFKAGLIDATVATWNAGYAVITMMVIFWFLMYLNGQQEGLSVGQFIAFNAAFTLLLAGLLTLSNTIVSILSLIPIYERAQPVLQAIPENDDTLAQPGELTGSIEISHLKFRYAADGPLIINDVSLQIAPGSFVAMVGPSGSGKSTLLRLLLGFEQAKSGAIYYDGQDLAGLDVRGVRRQIGVVLQNSQPVPGSIYENILGSKPLSIKQAWTAAAMAGFDQDIKDMPMGMHTVISESGGTLSGGQVQRLMIARALVSKPRVLYFDEATSALDNQTQAAVTASLDKLSVTRVVIAHRLSTIINADRIFVIDGGRLVQQGTYRELVAQEGIFKMLATRQLV